MKEQARAGSTGEAGRKCVESGRRDKSQHLAVKKAALQQQQQQQKTRYTEKRKAALSPLPVRDADASKSFRKTQIIRIGIKEQIKLPYPLEKKEILFLSRRKLTRKIQLQC